MSKEFVGTSIDGRKVFKVWSWDETFTLVQIEAWENQNLTEFWVPSRHATCLMGHSIYETKHEAWSEAKIILERQLKTIQDKMMNLEKSR